MLPLRPHNRGTPLCRVIGASLRQYAAIGSIAASPLTVEIVEHFFQDSLSSPLCEGRVFYCRQFITFSVFSLWSVFMRDYLQIKGVCACSNRQWRREGGWPPRERSNLPCCMSLLFPPPSCIDQLQKHNAQTLALGCFSSAQRTHGGDGVQP